MNTARVTSCRCCQSRARRRDSIGSIPTTFSASAGPSRSTKNSTNSIRRKLTIVPTAPSTTAPLEDTSASSTFLAPATSQVSICCSEMPV